MGHEVVIFPYIVQQLELSVLLSCYCCCWGVASTIDGLASSWQFTKRNSVLRVKQRLDLSTLADFYRIFGLFHFVYRSYFSPVCSVRIQLCRKYKKNTEKRSGCHGCWKTDVGPNGQTILELIEGHKY